MRVPLELSWRSHLELARLTPDEIDLKALLAQLDQTVAQVPETDRLQLAGSLLLQVAEVCAIRAEVLIAEWESANRDPVLETDFFSEMVRQTMAVDLSELIEPAPPRKRRANRASKTEPGSLVTLTNKAAVLAMLDPLEAQSELEASGSQNNEVLPLAIAHDESISERVGAIAQWMQQHLNQPTVSLATLHQALGLSLVDLWMGLLLGGFELEQQGEFYSSTIWVKNQAGVPVR